MIELGKFQELKIDRITPHGAYLTDNNDEKNAVLLPSKELGESDQKNEIVSVFVYRDSKDRLIATKKIPKIQLGCFAALKVVDITKVGAFLDWGLEKDLLLPYNEQIVKVHKGREYLVNLYIDKSDRLCATMKIYPLLKTNSKHQAGDWVEGYVYQINPEIGAFVAIENEYHGLIPTQVMNEDTHCGEKVNARVLEIRADGKLVLSPNRKAYKEIPGDAKTILSELEKNNGVLPFDDKSDPRIIKKEFNMSKASFKRAIGHLLKTKKIRLTEKGIERNGK
ncbi:S1-like domain-containing RNA-binding protein [Eubacteriaceae bacterium ES2]|nr:S1-like domain-containing RNA-binding protein [Eubacteriaceae bacterium ES2]